MVQLSLIESFVCGTCESQFASHQEREFHFNASGHGSRRQVLGQGTAHVGVPTAPMVVSNGGANLPARSVALGQNGPSAKQYEFLHSLLAERVGVPEAEAIRTALNATREARTLTGGTDGTASAFITALLAIPKPQKATVVSPTAPDVPEGRYALPAQDGHLVFYQVDKPKTGKWAGYTFCAMLLGSPGDFDKQRLSRDRSQAVLIELAKDPAAAALTFSRKFTVCSKCLAPLSKVQSRATGFGAVCAGHLGVTYLDRETALRVLQEEGISLDGLEDLDVEFISPIIYDGNGDILDGHHRATAMIAAGICPRHGETLNASGCWECNMEADIAERDREEG